MFFKQEKDPSWRVDPTTKILRKDPTGWEIRVKIFLKFTLVTRWQKQIWYREDIKSATPGSIKYRTYLSARERMWLCVTLNQTPVSQTGTATEGEIINCHENKCYRPDLKAFVKIPNKNLSSLLRNFRNIKVGLIPVREVRNEWHIQSSYGQTWKADLWTAIRMNNHLREKHPTRETVPHTALSSKRWYAFFRFETQGR